MRRRPLSIVVLAVLAAGLASCDVLTTNEGGTPIAIFVLNARAKGTGFTTAPTASFFRASNITFSSVTAATDSCVQRTYNPNAAPPAGTAPSIGGGSSVRVQVSGSVDSLKKASPADVTYRLATAAGMAFIPGDSITFSIAGDVVGFPAFTFTGRTPEPYSLNAIVIPPTGQAMTLTWDRALDDNAAMLVSLRFNDGTGSELNQQLVCDFRDDGAGTVQAALATRWANAALRDVYSQRLRTALVRVADNIDAWVNMIATFDRPTPVSP